MVNLAHEKNITMVVVTHEMGFARQVADRIVFMQTARSLRRGHRNTFSPIPKTSGCVSFWARSSGEFKRSSRGMPQRKRHTAVDSAA